MAFVGEDRGLSGGRVATDLFILTGFGFRACGLRV